MSLPSAEDRWLFAEGRHLFLDQVLGCRLDEAGATFRVWAPNAASASVVGDFNRWDSGRNPMRGSDEGVWEARVDGIGPGDSYKYHLVSRYRGYFVDKADPVALHAETSPGTASKAWDLTYPWGDQEWMATRGSRIGGEAPVSIYEVHLGSWRRDDWVTYKGIAGSLADYVEEMGFTHIELLPVMEHPYYASWGYQVTGYFAPTARYGTPQDLMYLIDHLHQRNIGVILDWVPSHFPSDEHGLGFFDGTHLYEHADPKLGFHPDWNSLIFNYGRSEVMSFLLSSAHHWLRNYHADGLRVDGVASMLYLDYSRPEGGWIPNRYGGRENLAAVELLRRLNTSIHDHHPGVVVIAEESTAWPMVTGEISSGGLGFDYKWDMGWMNDTLRYVSLDPIFRSHPDSHRLLTFRGLYANTENFMLSLSHDEVVHGKRSLLARQHGDGWRQFAGLRALYGYQWALPGKKLLFMGGEFGQWTEWNHEAALHWDLLQHHEHEGMRQWVRRLNHLYREEPSLHTGDQSSAGFQWVEADDVQRSVYAFLRWGEGSRPILVLANFTPVTWEDYLVGVPQTGVWRLLCSSDATEFGGDGVFGGDQVESIQISNQGFEQGLRLRLPPLSVSFLAPEAVGEVSV